MIGRLLEVFIWLCCVAVLVDVATGQDNPFDNLFKIQKQEEKILPLINKPQVQKKAATKKITYRLPRNYSHGGPTWYYGRDIQGRALANHILSTHRPMLMQMYGSKMTYAEIRKDLYTFNNRLLVALHSRLHNAEQQAARRPVRKGG